MTAKKTNKKLCACGAPLTKPTATKCRKCYLGDTKSALKARQDEFLKRFASYGTKGMACKSMGVDRSTVHEWIHSDPDFARKYRSAQLDRRDAISSRFYRTALGNLKDPLDPKKSIKMEPHEVTCGFGFLKATDHVQDEDDSLVFCEKSRVEVSGANGAPIKIQNEKIEFGEKDIAAALAVLTTAGAARVGDGNDPDDAVDGVYPAQADADPDGLSPADLS